MACPSLDKNKTRRSTSNLQCFRALRAAAGGVEGMRPARHARVEGRRPKVGRGGGAPPRCCGGCRGPAAGAPCGPSEEGRHGGAAAGGRRPVPWTGAGGRRRGSGAGRRRRAGGGGPHGRAAAAGRGWEGVGE